MANLTLVAGLGNPGPEYAHTRHNIGFLVVEEVARRLRATSLKRAHRAEIAEAAAGARKVLLAKPQTYMNNSGQSIASIMRFYKLPVEDLLVVYDDLDLAFGRIRIRPDGSAGGHNGVRSLIQSLNAQDFPRVRVGIGRPSHGGGISYVLGRWTQEERQGLSSVVSDAADAVEAVLNDGLVAAMNRFNSR
ncbi:MAG: aminoacyl-tRNA hydrolase [Chloroflexota bacterium]|nr:aminoacyl-tRNA hydrolase [Chloroflexota bacterium]